MKKLFKTFLVWTLLIIFVGCMPIVPKPHLPPGQVKKITGYNPASGKVQTKGPKFK